MRRRHFRGTKMMRTLESAIITLMSSSSGRGGQKSCTHFRGQEHSPPPFFCEEWQTSQRAKQRANTTARGQGKKQQTATFGLKGGWRPFQPRKKRLEEEHHYYYVTRGQERDTASTPTKRRRRRKYLSFPRNKHARKKSL